MAMTPSFHAAQQASKFLPDSEMPHVLIVDDNDDAAETCALFFESCGYHVSTASNGYAALRIWGDKRVDALITDFRMPGMNGEELITLMRADKPDLPAVILSGFTWEVRHLDFKTRVLPKPTRMPALVGIVEDLIDEG